MDYNKKHGIIPQTIKKDIYEVIEATKAVASKPLMNVAEAGGTYKVKDIKDVRKLDREELMKLIRELEEEMKIAAKNLEFERAAVLRDLIIELKGTSSKSGRATG